VTIDGALTRKCAAEEAYVGDGASRFVCPYQSVLLGAPQGILLLPITGHDIILANAKARTYLADLDVPETAEAIRARFFQLPRPGVPLAEHGDVSSDGRTYRYANYFFDGTHLLFIEDVTDQRRYQSIAANVDRENSMALLMTSIRQELARPVGDLKETLTAIVEGGAEAGGDHLDRVRHALAQVQAVEGVLDLLRSFQGVDASVLEPVRLDLFMVDFCEFLAGVAETHDICFSYVPFPPGLTVLAHPPSLRQALNNIAVNAFEAMEGLPGAALEVRVVADPRYATVVVEDTGPGIAPGVLRHAFTPLFTTKDGGAGLGLSVARNLVSGMKGDVEVRSQLGIGTVVSVSLQRIATQSEGPAKTRTLSVGR
jgi:signal transduction histidine kinase